MNSRETRSRWALILALALLVVTGTSDCSTKDSRHGDAQTASQSQPFSTTMGWYETSPTAAPARTLGNQNGWMENTAIAIPPNTTCPNGDSSGTGGLFLVSLGGEAKVLRRNLLCVTNGTFCNPADRTLSLTIPAMPGHEDAIDSSDNNLVRLPNGHVVLAHMIVRYYPTKAQWLADHPNGSTNPSASSRRRGIVAFFDSADCGATFPEVSVIDPGICGDLDHGMLTADSYGRLFYSVRDAFNSWNNPSSLCPTGRLDRFEVYKSSAATPSSAVFTLAATSATSGLHAETGTENGRLYVASCAGTPQLQVFDPTTNVISAPVTLSALTCDFPDNIVGNINITRVGSLETGDYVRVSWPHTLGSNKLALEIGGYKITGTSGNPMVYASDAVVEIRSKFTNGSIVQSSAIQTDRAQIASESRLNDTVYYWHDADGAYVAPPGTSYGTKQDIQAMLFRDSNSPATANMPILRSIGSRFVKDGDYEVGTSYFDTSDRKLKFIPIWTESPGSGHSLATAVVSFGVEEVFRSFTDQGGSYSSSPAVASWGDGRLDIFGLGTDNNVYHSVYDQSSGWWGYDTFYPPPGLTFASAPAAVSWSWGRIDVFIRASDNAIWTLAYVHPSGWTGWVSLGGALYSAPTVASWGVGRLDVFAYDGGHALSHKAYDVNQGGWADHWDGLGGWLSTAPAATSWGPGRIDVFALGGDNQMWHRAFDWSACSGDNWCPWDALDGYFQYAPAATHWGSNRLDVFAVGYYDNIVAHKSWDGSAWSSWLSVADSRTSFAPATVSSRPSRIDLLTIGKNSSSLRANSNILR